MVSVCMAVKNGELFIAEQLSSILHQLAPTDEVVICDDCSDDDTVAIINAFDDNRIRIQRNESPQGIVRSFERSLNASAGTFIFLADQDDVWLLNRRAMMMEYLLRYDMVVSDCQLVHEDLQLKAPSFFRLNDSGKGILKNIIRNSYMGCCMAFNRRILERALPFPPDVPMHDVWLGLVAELHYTVNFIPTALLNHRNHRNNATTTGQVSSLSFGKRLKYRYRLIKNLVLYAR
jgi:glycosyltransferase involved in cell wall biosynthesis